MEAEHTTQSPRWRRRLWVGVVAICALASMGCSRHAVDMARVLTKHVEHQTDKSAQTAISSLEVVKIGGRVLVELIKKGK